MPRKNIKDKRKNDCPTASDNEAVLADKVVRPEAKHELLKMDSDEILAEYGHGVAGRESRKKSTMKVSGKSVFKIKEIIVKKYKDNKGKN